jgi:hypothetical protein
MAERILKVLFAAQEDAEDEGEGNSLEIRLA